MRARVPLTVGLSLGASLALSVTAGDGVATIFVVCLALTAALALCGWVLSADDRTARLERLIRTLQGRSPRPARPAAKTIEPGTEPIEHAPEAIKPAPKAIEPGPAPTKPGPRQ